MADKDYTFDALYTSNDLQKLIYLGQLFSAGFRTNSVADAGMSSILFNARSDTLHLHPGWSFTGNGHVDFFRVESWTGGSALNPFNHYTKYEGVNSISSLLIKDVTSINVQARSAELVTELIPGGTKNNAQGGAGETEFHMIIEAGDTILIQLVNQSGSGASLGFESIIHETPINALDDPN